MHPHLRLRGRLCAVALLVACAPNSEPDEPPGSEDAATGPSRDAGHGQLRDAGHGQLRDAGPDVGVDDTRDAGPDSGVEESRDSGASELGDASVAEVPDGGGEADGGGSVQTGDPTLEPASGTYPYRTLVSLSAPEPGAELYYTLDGTPPTVRSKCYREPIALTPGLADSQRAVELRAVAVVPGKSPSRVVSASYRIEAGVIVHFKKPADWAGANVHYWGTQPNLHQSNWPGEPMSPEGNGWYFFVIEGERSANVVFNGGGNPVPQTDDLFVEGEDWCEGATWYGQSPAKLKGRWWGIDPARFERFAFPSGKYKALVMSYDDGNEPDRALVELFNQHGIKGTFHLNSGKLGTEDHIGRSEVPALFSGHEVSTHTLSHPSLAGMTESAISHELLADRDDLIAVSGQDVRGHSYPFGNCDNIDATVLKVLRASPIVYARMVPSTGGLGLPPELHRWEPTCHQNDAQAPGERLVAASGRDLALLFVWGHSWELYDYDPQKPNGQRYTAKNERWTSLETFCATVGGKADLWYATALEVADYLNAIRQADFSRADDSVTNRSSVSLWYEAGDSVVEIAPGERFPE